MKSCLGPHREGGPQWERWLVYSRPLIGECSVTMKNFSGAVAAITGAGSGMGRALALALAGRGCHLALADLDEPGLAETVRLVSETAADQNLTVSRHLVDVADREAVERFAAEAASAHGKINLVFNNAGVSVTGLADQLPFEDFHWLMNINFWGVVHGSRAFLPYIREAGEGHIVNTSSVFGLFGIPSQSAYNASKFAVKGFTDALRVELDGEPVAVSCVMPGGVKTSIVSRSRYLLADNQAPTREEAAQRFQQYAGLTADQAAAQILVGVAQGRARILVGRDAKVLGVLLRIFPVAYLRFLAWLQRRERASRASDPARQTVD